MSDTTHLHELTAELHAAVDQPQRWRAAWLALNEFMGLADQANDDPPASPAPGSAVPGWCGPGTDRRCYSPGYSTLRRSDPADALVGAGSDGGIHNVRCDLQATYLAALDALPVAAWLCTENRHILHANAAGRAELKRQRS
ncbi:MAG: hypothetical protein MUP33_07320, partial [Polaromonas sp.]|nr:hypothetical protein [Polaromonas sp.]